MSRGGVYRMNEKGERELITPPTIGIGDPKHRKNQLRPGKPQKVRQDRRKPGGLKAAGTTDTEVTK